jgi:SpoIVB peptidase
LVIIITDKFSKIYLLFLLCTKGEKVMRKNFAKIAVVLVLLLSYVYICSINSIPNNIIIFEGENLNLKIATGLTLASKNSKTILTASNINKEKINSEGTNSLNLNLFGTIPVKEVNVNVIPKTMVVPLGNAIGMKLYTKGVLVVGMSQIETDKNEKKKPYENSGIEQGDTILEINNNIVGNTEELIKEVENSKGNTINIKYLRDDKTMQTDITPVKSKNTYKIGLWVRDAAAGVGTLTFYEPSTNLFMALGHGISDIDTEEIVNIANGELVTANIVSITKGRKGYPGEIRGTIDEGKTIGTIYKNTNFGVYGMVKNKNYLEADLTQEMEVAPRNEIKEGKAQIICQLENSAKKKYDIEIEKVYINNNQNNKSMLIKITDKELLEKTGGIIQGMSGAPIIQEGKFVGAVTNVLVNDPTQGYGVFADIMIKEMRSI